MKFFFHYNKPASLKRGKPTISLHFKGTCHLVDNIYCEVPTHSRIRTSSPKFVMAGDADMIEIEKGTAYLECY